MADKQSTADRNLSETNQSNQHQVEDVKIQSTDYEDKQTQGKTKGPPWIPTKIEESFSLKVGADCSGMDTPLIALGNLGVPFKSKFSCDIDNIYCLVSQGCAKASLHSDGSGSSF